MSLGHDHLTPSLLPACARSLVLHITLLLVSNSVSMNHNLNYFMRRVTSDHTNEINKGLSTGANFIYLQQALT